MSNNKQSSVEWFWLNLTDDLIGDLPPEKILKIYELKEQAKVMEKKQCVDFALKCMLNGLEPHQSTREVVERLFDEDNLQ